MRDRIRTVGANLREFYPLWMRTAQTVGQAELGFTLAVTHAIVSQGKQIVSFLT